MPGRGPAPKPNAHRRASGKVPDPIPPTIIEDKPLDEPVGPPLPAEMDWPEVTLRWWETWRRSEQALTFTSTDWDFMLDTARLHAVAWTLDPEKVASRTGVFAELRLRVAKYGATPEDRQRLRMTMGRVPGDPAPKTVERPSAERVIPGDRRARLLRAVEDERAV